MKVSIKGAPQEIFAKREQILRKLAKDLRVPLEALSKAEPHEEDPLAHATIKALHGEEKAVVDEEYAAMLKEIEKELGVKR